MTSREIFYRNRAHDYLAAAQCARAPGARAALMEVVTAYTMLAELDARQDDGAAEQAEEIRSNTSPRPRNRYQAVAAALAAH